MAEKKEVKSPEVLEAEKKEKLATDKRDAKISKLVKDRKYKGMCRKCGKNFWGEESVVKHRC